LKPRTEVFIAIARIATEAVKIELTEEQRRAMQAQPEQPLELLNPETQQVFVLTGLGQDAARKS